MRTVRCSTTRPTLRSALCLGKRHNDTLLEGYPTADVVAANTSLAAAVNTLLACDALLRAIERTYEYLPDPGTPPA
ncbi:hypothetical protein [Nannocystis sp.]|uniref:hypothetical protein n=1 Tax=Nannocystis sp. TaxID=1962667 RepID=UPI0025DFC112|nr:hypothetical protein [Nannocystis sp.]